MFFVRNNYDAAPVDPAQWSLKIEGEVDGPVVLRLDDLKKLPAFTQDVTLECAGNGRSFHQPRASGIQWEHGAVGTQQFKGVRLADVLALARLRPGAQHVAFDGFDKVLGVISLRRAEDEQPPVPVDEIERLIEDRQAARRRRDFAAADRIRDDLAARGVLLEDSSGGTRWKRK